MNTADPGPAWAGPSAWRRCAVALHRAVLWGCRRRGDAGAGVAGRLPLPDGGLGPILSGGDAGGLAALLRHLQRRAAVPPIQEIRLSFLPACGVILLDRPRGLRPAGVSSEAPRRVMVVGLPALQVWTVAELRSVFAHELAHLRGPDAVYQRDVVDPSRRLGGPLGRLSLWAAGAVVRRMEHDADAAAAAWTGSRPLIGALEKLLVAQAVFDQTLTHCREQGSERRTVYEVFAAAWQAMPAESFGRLRDTLLERQRRSPDRLHPTLAERIDRLRRHPTRSQGGDRPALELLGRRAALMRVLHNRLYAPRLRRTRVFEAVRR